MQPSVVFLQQRAHVSGATKSLARLLRHGLLRPWHPVLVTGSEGWLSKVCREAGIPVIVERFPGSRSILGRLWRNAAFAGRVWRRLHAAGIRPMIIHANDHGEALLGLALARRTQARTAVFLRSSGMSRRDFEKYRCAEYDLIIAVGDELQERAQMWDPAHRIRLIHNGVEPADYAPVKPKSESFPDKILVIGCGSASKGWADLTEALYLLQQRGELPCRQWDFTDAQPDPSADPLGLKRLKIGKFRFLGRAEQYRDLVREYDLAIQPSRRESFGMAAIEVLFAGVPLFSTRVGVIEQVLDVSEFLVAPGQPKALAEALRQLIREWPHLDPGVERAQEKIRSRFMIDHTAHRLTCAYREIGVDALEGRAEDM
jgi:glycosyltransferase involved in cell wall biosynthesis